ncbi:MAG: hypothetical protein PHO67_02170 [Candidatus Omnitrophica bacterium]|nr:hypothetical protein [Candidatus Omnitrophota bacterium]
MNQRVTEESKVAAWLSGFYGESRSIIGDLIKNSKTAVLLSRIKQGFFNKAVRSASIFIFTAVMVNIFLDLALHKEMSLLDMIIKSAVLILCLGGFSCETGWQEIKKNSFILSKIFK